MARRPGYKGAANSSVRLPMDSATVIGAVAIFGSILPAQGLSAEALKKCTTFLESLESFTSFDTNFLLIPELPQLVLPFENSLVKSQAVTSVLKKLELMPDRPGCFVVDKQLCLDKYDTLIKATL